MCTRLKRWLVIAIVCATPAAAYFLELAYLPLRAAWMAFWGTWARFFCTVRLWHVLGYRWGAAWQTSSYLTEDRDQ